MGVRAGVKQSVASRVFPAGEQKVFGIGLHKTGTRSLADALRLLGYRTLHRGDEATSVLVDRAIAEGRRPLVHLGEQYEAYLDVRSIVREFDLLDRSYPGSRFILTTSPEDEWLDSRARHVVATAAHAGAEPDVDIESWRGEWCDHHRRVDEYFRHRPSDLLVMDVRSGDGWEHLAPFLGARVPDRDFPWENRRGRGTYDRDSSTDRLRRRLHVLEGIGRRRRWWK